MYITIQSFNNMHGSKPLKLNGLIKLVKDYVANSTNTVVIGSMSAGRLYDKINDEYFAKIKFVTGSVALARVLTSDEYIAEVENPESDIHYLSDNLGKIDVDFIKKNIRGEADDSQL